MEEKDIGRMEETMPDMRVRPSALTPLGNLFGLASAATTMVLGKQYANVLLYSAEKGIMVTDLKIALTLSLQDEIDEHLRIMNERGIKEEPLRKQMIEMRDTAYDQFSQSENRVDIVRH